MKKIHVLILLCVIALSCTTEKKPAEKNDIQPPSPEKVPHELTAHGASRTDNYYERATVGLVAVKIYKDIVQGIRVPDRSRRKRINFRKIYLSGS